MKKILVILLIITGVYITFFQSNISAWWPHGKQSTEAEVTKSIDFIDINVSGASTTIIPDNNDTIRAELKGKGKVTVNKNGEKITLQFKKNWFEWLGFFNKSKLTIFIPEDYNQDLSIDIGSGNLNYAGHSNNNPIELEELSLDMSSGNVVLSNITTETFKHDGSSGNLHMNDVTTETGSFDISSGNIELVGYQGEMEAELSSGNLNVQMDELSGSVDIEVSSGKVSLDLPDDADFSLKGDVSSGHINCDFPLKGKVMDKNEIKGIHGSGKHKIDLDVSSGIIEIY